MCLLDSDRPHALFPYPVYWGLIEFTYRGDPKVWRESFVELVFDIGGGERRFRFFAPTRAGMAGRLPIRTGVLVLDITARQWEGVSVMVCPVEPMQNDTVEFVAADVVEVNEHGDPV
ncbi:MAG: hypothetical protein U0804_05890 [Gemmataceae bacterium]